MPELLETLTEQIEPLFELIGLLFDVAGVMVICLGALLATVRYLRRQTTGQRTSAPGRDISPFQRYRTEIGLSLLLGLEILVAADIIKTVAVEPSFTNLGILGVLVLIRTFLNWTLTLEIEGRWPWQNKGEADPPNLE